MRAIHTTNSLATQMKIKKNRERQKEPQYHARYDGLYNGKKMEQKRWSRKKYWGNAL